MIIFKNCSIDKRIFYVKYFYLNISQKTGTFFG